MKSIDDLDYYELLEIPRVSSAAEVERAYRLARQTYAEGSLALYSIFESLDAAAIRHRLDEAYRVLSDPEARGLYDRNSAVGPSRPGHSLPGTGGASEPGGLGERRREPEAFRERDPSPFGVLDEAGVESLQDYESFDEMGQGDFDGVRLRRARLFRGYELDQISEVTKVSGSHLRNIEEENFEDLPADVYVRGFVTAYARTIGLDPEHVVPSYMARVQESRGEGGRNRLLGRR